MVGMSLVVNSSLWARFVASPVATFVAYATCVLIWGTTWLAIKISLTGFDAVTGAGVRFIVASGLLYAMAS